MLPPDLAPIVAEAESAFAREIADTPPMSLRAGNAVDNYEFQPAYSQTEDRLSDAYLERHYWGIAHLDPISFRHYIPALVDYGLRHLEQGSNVVDTFLLNLRPPDRDPPRLGSLSPAQEAVIVKFLDIMAFTTSSVFKEDAMLALEKWWAPVALYRHRKNA
jgi:hypothetical protein